MKLDPATVALYKGDSGDFGMVREFARRYTLARPGEYVVIGSAPECRHEYVVIDGQPRLAPPKRYTGYTPDVWSMSLDARRYVNPVEVWRNGQIVPEDPFSL
jgi:hypothetical protein